MEDSIILNQLRELNWDLLKDPDNYLFIGENVGCDFIVTNLDMDNILFPVNSLYRDGFIIIDGVSYKVVSRERYLQL